MARAYCKDNYFEVDFGELTRNPENVLENVCDFVGVKSNRKMKELFSAERASQFSSHFDFEENKYFNALAGDLIKEFNWV